MAVGNRNTGVLNTSYFDGVMTSLDAAGARAGDADMVSRIFRYK